MVTSNRGVIRAEVMISDHDIDSIFPIFKSRRGPLTVARDRWHSFGLFIERFDRNIVQPGDWTTYRHRDENPLLEWVPVTMREWLDAHPDERVAMWR